MRLFVLSRAVPVHHIDHHWHDQLKKDTDASWIVAMIG